MASFVLGSVGNAIGGPIGGFVGGVVGSFIDNSLFGPGDQSFTREGPRLGDLKSQAHSPGAPITIPYGREVKTAGALIWTSNLIETRHEETTTVEGGKGLGPPESSATEISYTYSVDVAVMICEGPIDQVTRIWANNKLLYDDGSSPKFSRAADIRIALGTQTQESDSMLEAVEGAGNVPAFRGRAVAYIQGLQLADFGNITPQFDFEVARGASADTTRTVIADLCERAGLASSEFDVDGLQIRTVRGFALSNVTSPRGAAEALQRAYLFDMADTGYKLVFRDRQRRADALIFAGDLAARRDGEPPEAPEATVRGQDRELPQEVVLRFVDPDRELDINSVTSPRLSTESRDVAVFTVPITMAAAMARQAVEDLSVEFWLQRMTKRIRLPVKYLGLDAGDVVHIAYPGTSELSERFRVMRIWLRADGIIEAELTRHVMRWARGLQVADAGAAHVLAQEVPVLSDTVLYLLDLPLLTADTPDKNGFYSAVRDAGNENKWTGAWVYRALDGATYSRVRRHDVEVTTGSCVTALPAGATLYPDRKSTLRIRLEAGTPSETTDAGLQRAGNAAVCGASGRWEVLQWRDAAQVSGTVWEFSHFTRGLLGTEHAVAGHAAGDRFFVLNEARVKRVEQELNLLNAAVSYKGVTFFQAVADATAQSFTNTGECMTPWAPVQVSGARDGSDNLTITFNRRDRLPSLWFQQQPLSEASEHYEIDVLDGSTVVRTITASSPSAGYTAAQQTTDFGSVQASVVVDIFQISQRVGRGHALRATV